LIRRITEAMTTCSIEPKNSRHFAPSDWLIWSWALLAPRAAAPTHMASEATPQSDIHAYSPARADTGIQTLGLIFSRGYYVGRDPDAAIRFQLVRGGWYGTR
jgi:hypothetical protein